MRRNRCLLSASAQQRLLPCSPQDSSCTKGMDMADGGSNERELVSRVCAGDPSATETLFRICDSAIVALSSIYPDLSFRLNEGDLLQDLLVFLLGEGDWKPLRTWEGRSSLKAWLQVIAIRRYFRELRRHRRERPLTAAVLDAYPNASGGPDDALIDAEDASIHSASISSVLKAIEQLSSEKEKEVILMSFNGYSPAAIAEILEITPDDARVTKHRAISHLRELLRGGLANV